MEKLVEDENYICQNIFIGDDFENNGLLEYLPEEYRNKDLFIYHKQQLHKNKEEKNENNNE